MRHAMLICVHKNFNILQSFIDLFDDERFDFYILLDKKVPVDETKILQRHPQKSKLYFCPRINISWAGHSQIKAVLELFKISSENKYDYYHFFQGSDFPLKTCNYVDSFFSQNKGKEFINIYLSEFAKTKCGYYHFFTNNRYYRYNILFKAADKLLLMFQKLLRIHRNQDLPLYAGSALTSLTHACVMYILSKEPEIRRRFYYSLAADEVFLQTMIGNSPFRDKIYQFDQTSHANVRLIDWEKRDDNSPYTFKSNDFEMLIHADSDICFARKFDENIDFEIVQKLFDFLSNQTG